MKLCLKCNKLKELNNFYQTNNYFSSPCKECRKVLVKKRYYSFGKEKIKQYEHKRARDCKRIEKHRIYCLRWYRKSKGKEIPELPLKSKSKYYSSINYKLSSTLRGRTGHAIKQMAKRGSSVLDLGCTIEELKIYIESKFHKGMNWSNWSRYGWHIDHIKPLSKFDLSNRVQYLQAVNYKNLQPLWAKDNLIKKNR